jgi:hypothetical protein
VGGVRRITAVALAGIGLLRLHRKAAVPNWVSLLITWQGFCLLFLMVVQLRYGSMYSASEPAFVTPRFFTLAQPLNVCALLFLVPVAFPGIGKRLGNTVVLLLLVCLFDWVSMNHRLLRDRSLGVDGFLRPTDLAAVHRVLQSQPLQAIFNGAGVFTYTATDPRIIYPDNIDGFRVLKSARIAVVRFAGDPNRLLDALQRKMPAIDTQRIGTFEVAFFDLPKGFELFTSSAGMK